MMRFIIIPIVLLGLISCGTDSAPKSKEVHDNTPTVSKQDHEKAKINTIQDTTSIKKWLTKVIIDYLNENDDLKGAYSSM